MRARSHEQSRTERGEYLQSPGNALSTLAIDGVLGSVSKLRALVVPPLPPKAETDVTHTHREHPPTHRSVCRTCAELMLRTFQIDTEIYLHPIDAVSRATSSARIQRSARWRNATRCVA
jgi:hypothetical protein